MGSRSRWAIVAALAIVATLLVQSVTVVALTAPQGPGVAKPDGLTLRVPWAPGTSHVLGDYRYEPANEQPSWDHDCHPGGSQDCYALDIVGSADYPLTSDMSVYPLFRGTVRYSGCARGGFAGCSGW